MKNKILIYIITVLLILLIIPFIAMNIIKPNEGMGFLLLMFFIINPIVSILLGVLSGKNISKLFWIPISFAILFPVLYVFTLEELVMDLYLYSIGYLVLGLVSMTVTYYLNKRK